MNDDPKMVVLLAAYNGAEFIERQLESIVCQTYGRVNVVVGDDGSLDDTRTIVEKYSVEHPQVSLLKGPRKGSAHNFLFMILESEEHIRNGCWIAFSDQDDFWLPEKLTLAINRLKKINAKRPAIYSSRQYICDKNLEVIGESRNYRKLPSFSNALVQNILTGHTIVMNSSGAMAALKAAKTTKNLVEHDWWLYLFFSGTGAEIVFDETATVLYRQHAGNKIGAGHTISSKVLRIFRLFRGDFRSWNDTNIAFLEAVRHLLTEENQRLLDEYKEMRKANLIRRCNIFFSSGIFRHSRASQFALIIAMLFKRI